jgi:hypothetical protein
MKERDNGHGYSFKINAPTKWIYKDAKSACPHTVAALLARQQAPYPTE